MVQRYVLAVLYYSTTSTSSNVVHVWDNANEWLSSIAAVSECQWFGVTCTTDINDDDTNNGNGNGGWITKIELQGNNLVGTMPDEMRHLGGSLIYLDMGRNTLSGSIPESLGDLTLLQHLDLDKNYRLGGTLPASLFDLKELEFLDLDRNMLSGTIGDDIGTQLMNLSFVQLSYNSFSGTIPASFALLNRMSTLTLEGNDLTGVMPEGVCDLLLTSGNGVGILENLFSDCGPDVVQVQCDCCTECFNG